MKSKFKKKKLKTRYSKNELFLINTSFSSNDYFSIFWFFSFTNKSIGL